MNILEILKTDYQNFPKHQTFSIYASDVYFRDPLSQFRGIDRYRQMIGFLDFWFGHPQLDLHDMERTGNQIRTEWTLSLTTPFPWKNRITIPGWSELQLNEQGLICSHIDYWRCSRWDVVKQYFIPTTVRPSSEKPIK
ncbi:MAG: DUF2358 domain-containing protein [Scytolyngbya sp. HA4215-MV1]|jgi:hypothetical protein|nr:DUF2358 domain-containing protein [Scytolyngbya sp. HA4215-MV1]